MQRHSASLGYSLECVTDEFNVNGGLLYSVLRRQRERVLLLEVFNATWTGFVVYDGALLYTGMNRTHVPVRTSVGALRTFFDSAIGHDNVIIKNVYAVARHA